MSCLLRLSRGIFHVELHLLVSDDCCTLCSLCGGGSKVEGRREEEEREEEGRREGEEGEHDFKLQQDNCIHSLQ